MSTEADRKAAYALVGKLGREAIEMCGPLDSLPQGVRLAVLEVARQLELAGAVPPPEVAPNQPIVVTADQILDAVLGGKAQ